MLSLSLARLLYTLYWFLHLPLQNTLLGLLATKAFPQCLHAFFIFLPFIFVISYPTGAGFLKKVTHKSLQSDLSKCNLYHPKIYYISYQACSVRSNGICDFFRPFILFIRNQCQVGVIKI